MKYSITTYDNEGNEIVTRNYKFSGQLGNNGDNLENILADSLDYLADEQVKHYEATRLTTEQYAN